MNRWTVLLLPALLALSPAARSEVVDSQANGFTTRQTALVNAPIRKVWDILVEPRLWWSSEHTFSGDARNLSLTPLPGGEWLETLPGGGGVRHLVVVWIRPPSALRFEGALGPLQGLGVVGHLTFTLKAQGDATTVSETYDVGGHAPGGLQTMAGPVDGVLGQQLLRLKAVAETGKAP